MEISTYYKTLDDDFLRSIQQQMLKIRQRIQHLRHQNREPSDMEYLILYLRILMIKAMIDERLVSVNRSVNYDTYL